jgi:WhiB family transcriptional regulator, redox-sensing transcriptional regulator
MTKPRVGFRDQADEGDGSDEDLMHARSLVAMVATAAAEGRLFSDDVAVSDHGACNSPATAARIEWVAKAQCRSSDPDELFVGGAAQRKAVVICRDCPVIAECAADALDNQIEFGVWGGMTERQRRALLKQHPEVDSWSKFFAAQRKHRNTDSPA